MVQREPRSHQNLGNESLSEDISGYSISDKSEDFDHFKKSVQKVSKQGKEGRQQISRRIIREMDSKTLERLQITSPWAQEVKDIVNDSELV